MVAELRAHRRRGVFVLLDMLQLGEDELLQGCVHVECARYPHVGHKARLDAPLAVGHLLEEALLLVVGPLLDVFDHEALVVQQVLGSRPGVVVDVEASLDEVKVLA